MSLYVNDLFILMLYPKSVMFLQSSIMTMLCLRRNIFTSINHGSSNTIIYIHKTDRQTNFYMYRPDPPINQPLGIKVHKKNNTNQSRTICPFRDSPYLGPSKSSLATSGSSNSFTSSRIYRNRVGATRRPSR